MPRLRLFNCSAYVYLYIGGCSDDRWPCTKYKLASLPSHFAWMSLTVARETFSCDCCREYSGRVSTNMCCVSPAQLSASNYLCREQFVANKFAAARLHQFQGFRHVKASRDQFVPENFIYNSIFMWMWTFSSAVTLWYIRILYTVNNFICEFITKNVRLHHFSHGSNASFNSSFNILYIIAQYLVTI
jgi:hypothetical protein